MSWKMQPTKIYIMWKRKSEYLYSYFKIKKKIKINLTKKISGPDVSLVNSENISRRNNNKCTQNPFKKKKRRENGPTCLWGWRDPDTKTKTSQEK